MSTANAYDPVVETLIKDLQSQGKVRLLDPIDRVSEILFGLFMAVSYTHLTLPTSDLV